MKKLLIALSLILLMVIMSGCLINTKDTLNEDKSISDTEMIDTLEKNEEPYLTILNSLLVSFNGQTKDGITATTYLNRTRKPQFQILNEEFKAYFLNDLQIILTDIEGVNNITIYSWIEIVDQTNIRLDYVPDLSDEEKKEILTIIQTKLGSKWYIHQVYSDEAYDTLE